MTAQRKQLAILLAQMAYGMLAMALCLPSMPSWAGTFGASTAQVQLTFAAYVTAFGLMQLVYGPLSDRHGRRPMLLLGLVLAAAGSVLAALAHSIEVLALARAVQGMGAAAGVVVGRALVQDLYQGPERTRVMAWVGMAMGVTPPLATLLGGQLHERLGWASTFWLSASLAAALLAAVWWGLPRRHASSPAMQPVPPVEQQALWRGYLQLVRLPVYVWHVAILGFAYATLYAFLSGAPVVLAQHGVSPSGVGWFVLCMTASYIAGSFLTTRWIHRMSARRLMTLGQWLTLAGTGLMLLLAWLQVPVHWSMTLPLLLVGLGHGLLVPPTLAGTVGQIPALAGAAAAVAGLMQQVMGAAGSYTVGALEPVGVTTLAALMLVFTLLALASQWAAQSAARSTAPPPTQQSQPTQRGDNNRP